MFKVILAGIVGVAAGVALAAWAETMDDGTSSTIEDVDKIADEIEELFNDEETVVNEESDETLKDMATDNG